MSIRATQYLCENCYSNKVNLLYIFSHYFAIIPTLNLFHIIPTTTQSGVKYCITFSILYRKLHIRFVYNIYI